MAEQQLTLTAGEHELLVALLSEAQKEARVEEHRTRTLSYREQVVHREELIAGLLAKLQPVAR